MNVQEDPPSGGEVLLVVIIGWMGCQDRRLEVYRRLYGRLLEKPRLVCRILPPAAIVASCLGQAAPMDAVAAELVQTIQEERKCDKVIFHCFSNSGYLLWNSLCRHRDGAKIPIAGVVFDSCPVADMSLIADALQHCSWHERAAVIRSCGLAYLDNTRLVSPVPQDDTSQAQVPSSCFPPPVELYLYSRTDPLAPSDFVDAFVQQRREQQQQQLATTTRSSRSKVYSCVFAASPHCDHLRRYPEAYERSVSQLLATALAQGRSKL